MQPMTNYDEQKLFIRGLLVRVTHSFVTWQMHIVQETDLIRPG